MNTARKKKKPKENKDWARGILESKLKGKQLSEKRQ